MLFLITPTVAVSDGSPGDVVKSITLVSGTVTITYLQDGAVYEVEATAANGGDFSAICRLFQVTDPLRIIR